MADMDEDYSSDEEQQALEHFTQILESTTKRVERLGRGYYHTATITGRLLCDNTSEER